jgi:hypothetical protein
LFRVVYKGSLAHAEVLEDVGEDFVRGDDAFAGYFGKLGEDYAQVFCY